MIELNRTDLAVESHESYNGKGVEIDKEKKDGIDVTKLTVKTDEAAKGLKKPKGKYVTLYSSELLYNTDVYTKMCKLIADTINELTDKKGSLLVAGLGNRNITPDSLGPEVVARVFVTNHIKRQLQYDFVKKLGSVSAVAPGVLGTTGMETASILHAIVREEKPDFLIVVDAYAAKNLSRIATTIQISDAGTVPGGGVANRQNVINSETMGVPVIAIGVPTVVDAATVAADVAGAERLKMHSGFESLVVTPKNIDLVIDRSAKTVANGINLCMHPNLSIEEIESYIG